MPWHWGYKGISKGDVVNDLSALVGDPNVTIHEAKVFVCRVETDLSPGPPLSPLPQVRCRLVPSDWLRSRASRDEAIGRKSLKEASLFPNSRLASFALFMGDPPGRVTQRRSPQCRAIVNFLPRAEARQAPRRAGTSQTLHDWLRSSSAFALSTAVKTLLDHHLRQIHFWVRSSVFGSPRAPRPPTENRHRIVKEREERGARTSIKDSVKTSSLVPPRFRNLAILVRTTGRIEFPIGRFAQPARQGRGRLADAKQPPARPEFGIASPELSRRSKTRPESSAGNEHRP